MLCFFKKIFDHFFSYTASKIYFINLGKLINLDKTVLYIAKIDLKIIS